MKMQDLFLRESANVSIPVHQKFTFDGIAYDSEQGLGSVPFNSNVLYVGFAAVLSADDFLSLAKPADRMDSAKKFADMIIDEGVSIAPPFLTLSPYEDEQGKMVDVYVDGHEGRGRALAIKLLAEGYRKEDQKTDVSGDVMVHFFMQRGYRSRHLDEAFFEMLQKGNIENEAGNRVNVKFKKFFHDPKWR